jgi:hypothetical protein
VNHSSQRAEGHNDASSKYDNSRRSSKRSALTYFFAFFAGFFAFIDFFFALAFFTIAAS